MTNEDTQTIVCSVSQVSWANTKILYVQCGVGVVQNTHFKMELAIQKPVS